MKNSFVFLLFLPAVAFSDMKFTDVARLIERHDARSVEDLLPLLPQEYKDHFALVHTGRGAQETSFENPRAILFGRNAKTVFAINGHSSQRGFYDFEMREFNSATGKFEYRAIHFNDERGRPTFSEVNPRACLKCHGNNPLPIFEHYFSGWEGWYQDNSSDTEKEVFVKEYKNFVDQMPSHPRYRFLNSQFMPPAGQATDHASLQPLNMLGKLQSRWVGAHIASEFRSQSEFSKLRYTTLFYYLGGSFGYLGNAYEFKDCQKEELRKKIWQTYVQVLKQKFGREAWFSKIEQKMGFDFGFFGLIPLVFDYHQDLTNLIELQGFSRMNTFFRDGVDAPIHHAVMDLLGDEIRNQSELAKNLIWDAGRMSRFFGARYSGQPAKDLDGALMWIQVKPEICSQLAEKAEKELERFR